LHLHIRAVDAELGVVSGIDQPVDGKIDRAGPWDSTETIRIPVYGYRGLNALLHAFADFWTHKV
jgi:hypothetical protein